MRRISIDAFGMTGSKSGGSFYPRKRRSPWYLSRPRLLTTFLAFVLLYAWLHFCGRQIKIPQNSWDYVQDASVATIVNATLGFQKILVLNLPFRTDRRDAMSLSAATSNIQLEFVDGVTADSIKESAYPPPDENIKLIPGIRGSWRTHMNALQRVVEQNLTTALILEDDVDWDVRVRQNLQRFALASRILASNDDVLSSSPRPKIEHVPNFETEETAFRISDNHTMPHLPTLPLASLYRASAHPAHHAPGSPYGDPTQWDVLWMGHCGAGFPRDPASSSSSSSSSPGSAKKPDASTATVVLTSANDDTVPAQRHLKAHPFQSSLDPLGVAFPPHTRVYHRASGGELCTVGYAVSQRGARRLLHQFGIKGWSDIFDAELGRWCAGEALTVKSNYAPSPSSKTAKDKEKQKQKERVCIATQPPIFAHHHPREGQSDIGGLGGGYATKYETKYLRYSVRMNLERLVAGFGERELVDQWPDEGGQNV